MQRGHAIRGDHIRVCTIFEQRCHNIRLPIMCSGVERGETVLVTDRDVHASSSCAKSSVQLHRRPTARGDNIQFVLESLMKNPYAEGPGGIRRGGQGDPPFHSSIAIIAACFLPACTSYSVPVQRFMIPAFQSCSLRSISQTRFRTQQASFLTSQSQVRP
eukprot:COSAG01_NODE_477_length_16509_cov_38.684217_11_plen_160_part_00